MKKTTLPVAILFSLMLMAPIVAQPIEDPTWVVMRGRVVQYGAQSATGWCGVLAEIREWAHAFVAWTPSSGPQIATMYRFYAARLVNTTLVELDHNGADLYVEGFWDVYNVTFIYEPSETPGSFNMTIMLLVHKGAGTLTATGDWRDFTVDIEGLELINGVVTLYAIRSMRMPSICDVSGMQKGVPDGTVNIYDLVHVGKAYGSTPGSSLMPDYEFGMDFNFDYIIDVYDLTTIAVSLGEEY